MNQRETSGHNLWLFDLAHGNLSDEKILKGFIKYYALTGCTLDNVIDAVVFRTHYNPARIKERLIKVLEKAAGESK